MSRCISAYTHNVSIVTDPPDPAPENPDPPPQEPTTQGHWSAQCLITDSEICSAIDSGMLDEVRRLIRLAGDINQVSTVGSLP